ncbi:MAG: ABC transporter permease subunit [Spirochaetales bacterium]|nr:ABC transporter permease subunit [Spirochaetales bacterium]
MGLKKTNRHLLLNDLKQNRSLWAMLIPAAIFFIAFNYIPMGGVILAFKDFNYVDGILRSPMVGFENFKFLLLSGKLWNITWNTIRYNIVFSAVGLVLQLSIAIFVTRVGGRLYKKFLQSVIFLPYFISFVILGSFTYNIFNYEFGALNAFLTKLGLERLDVFGNPDCWLGIMTFFANWKWMGWGSVIYIATITGFDPQIYEAAEVDGASIWQQIRKITLPMLKPTIIVICLFDVSRILKGNFELFYNIIGDNATLFNATDVIDTYVFRSLTRNFNVGIGSAVGLYQSLFGLVLIVTVNWIVKKIDENSALF